MDSKRILKKIAIRIRDIRKEKGMTQEELARAIKKKRPVLQRIESGSVNPSIYILYEIAGGLGIKLAELLKGL